MCAVVAPAEAEVTTSQKGPPMTLLDTPTTGRLHRPGDPDWDAARQAFNTTLDLRPAAVARPGDEREVAAVVAHARSRGLRVAPQATGHGAGPLSDLSDTIIVNTARLRSVSIDGASRRVRVGAGVKWEQVTPELSDLGLAALHGSSSDVGIAGYSLGGGMGWLARRYGLQANSVTAIELVTAEGHLVRTDAAHEPDLFWALRGGGGNFGVVTALEFTVYPVPELYAGALFFPFDRSGEVLHVWNDLLPTLPDELMSWATLLHLPDDPAVPDELRGGSFAIVMAAFLGSASRGRDLLRPLHDLGPATDTFATVPPIALGPLALEDPAEPIPYQSAHHLLDTLPPAAVDDLLAVAGPGAESPPTMVQLRHMGGALARETPGAGARATLPGTVSLFSLTMVDDPASAPAVRHDLDAVHAAVADHRVGQYANFAERPTDAATFFDPGTWERLREVKTLYDPSDLFRGHHHIPPLQP
jgi:FAD/FMN-containing dehydrogenase